MASTRSKNTPGNYQLETGAYLRQEDRNNRGPIQEAHLPGYGLLGQTCPAHLLATNAPDVESFLFGIGSTNLVQAQAPTTPHVTPMAWLDIAQKPNLVMPQAFSVLANQRPELR